MKKFVLLAFFAAVVSVIVYSYPGGAAAEAGRDGTGAEGNQGGCGSCHNSGTTDATKVELDSAGVAVTSYQPGGSYTVKISASNGSTTSLTHFGFQLAVVLASGAGTSSAVNTGTWGSTLPTDVQYTLKSTSGLDLNIIEQDNMIPATTGTGGNGSTYVESIPWTAPASGTGSVVIYGIVNEASSESQSKYEAATPVTITEAVAAAPVASVSISETSGSSTICQGSSVTFTATPTNGGSAPTYQWKVNGTAISGATSATYTTTTLPAGSDVITCVMTSNLNGVTGSPATSNSVTVTVNASVAPSVSISPSSNPACAGTNVTFTATPTNGGASPAYQWFNNGNTISGATSATYSSSSLANGNVITVELTSDASCASPTTVTSTGITMNITAPVAPSVSIASNVGNSICAGQSVILTATPTNGGSSPAYQWYKNGSQISGATSSNYTTTTLANNDQISVSMTSNASCVSPATASSNIITFSIVSNATPSVSIVSNQGTTICSGTSVTFTATPTNGGSGPTYQWYKNGSQISGATSSAYTTNSLSNNDQIDVIMTSNSACVSTTQATSNTLTMTVSATSAPSVTISSNSGTNICSGIDVTFTATPINGGSSPTYQWLDSGSPISGATGSTYSSSSLSNGESVSVSMTSNSSCASPTTATSNSLIMNVSSSLTASVSVSSSLGSTICTGQTPTFTANPVNGGSAPTYQWMVNSSNISGATSSTYTPNSVNNGDVITVQMTSNAQCVTQATVTSTGYTITVSSGGAPTITVTSNEGTSICQGTTVTFTAAATLAGTSPTYQWTKNSNHVGANSATYIDNSLVNGDVINCLLTSSLSCASPTTASSPDVTMTVNTPAAVSITATGDTLNATSAVSYQWYENNITIPNATSQSYVATTSGNYSVVITDVNGCQNSANYSYTTAINDVSALAGIRIYPNPANEVLTVDLSAVSAEGKITVRLFDLSGRSLIDDENAVTDGGKTSLNLQGVAGGVYMLQVSQGSEMVYRKVIVGK